MAKNKKIKINLLDSRSLDKAIQEIRQYQNSLPRKVQTFIGRLAKEGLQVVQSTMESVPDEEKGSYYTEIVNTSNGDIIGAAIRLTGDKVLFIEFSAGITYGTDNYPLPSGDKYGMGTYPGKGHWNSPYGWWYVDEQGNKHHSYGNRAYMPMYHAEQAIIKQVRRIAKEVFG